MMPIIAAEAEHFRDNGFQRGMAEQHQPRIACQFAERFDSNT